MKLGALNNAQDSQGDIQARIQQKVKKMWESVYKFNPIYRVCKIE